ncbi:MULTISPECIES: LysR family transcriptional regulator [Cryobacterium]|uniref:DNA-binding transcriptional regulator, LysR family n=1 Tax=Cryobacterium levicorallinum TaxID=995038 RepID=A0A1I3C2S2_9MICO|nr:MULTISPECIES: LysR family transcriptional regulator [Cryobacterium]TFB85742.1 LysR family transcriptional regulator [Cryobacterium levicorallinum]TFD65810.1 LysR family transcriptional regulator [Cryobacterium sp. Hh38]GEP27338.1 LysR family transcriptional regulator [Cryobacterium levicorallinum]SFH68865.1 DNA-binding transcriptional regulator, LysR family [Cryobacterium levicorallinum]
MTITQLRAFLLAATLGSFTAAALALGTAQPTVSELVRKLEVEGGLPLFARTGRRLVLTSAGEELLPWARRVVDGVDGARQTLDALRGITGGVASFGVLRNAGYYFLSDLAERFHAERPGVRTRLVGQNSVEVADGVRGGELEAGLAVLPIDNDGLSVTPLLRDEVVWASADPRRLQAPMTIAAIGDAPLILYDAHYGWNDPTRRQLAERAQLIGVRLEPMIEVENVESALVLVARGMGDTLLSRAVASSAGFPASVGTVSFAEPLFDTIALITREGATLSPATAELARLATEMLRAPSLSTDPL